MLNQEAIGRRYPEQSFEVTAEAIQAFARACNEDNPRFLDDARPEGLVAPPTLAIVAAQTSEVLPLTDESLTGDAGEFFRRMVRGDNDILWSDVIRPGDRLSTTAVVSGIEVKPNGELLRVDVTVRRSGREIARVGCGYFVRGESGAAKTPAGESGTSPIPRTPVMHAVDMKVTPDQPLRYADASGDRNPIHTDPQVATMFGHPGIILQGSCTMSFVAKAVLDTCCDGDPKRLKRLRVRYARPVLPGDTVTTILWRIEDQTMSQQYGIETKKQDGTVVIKNAFAEIAKT